MINLNFPEFDAVLKKEEGKVWIFDVIRKKYVVVTPEEWVRQHLIHFFIEHLGYPRSLIKVETGLTYNSLVKRADVVVYDRIGRPWLIVECKAYNQPVNTNTVHQVSTYNQSIEAKYVAITNGLRHYCFEVDHERQLTHAINNFPGYGHVGHDGLRD